MMRRDNVIVNEMEFRMLQAAQLISPRSHRAAMKGFSPLYSRKSAARRCRLHRI